MLRALPPCAFALLAALCACNSPKAEPAAAPSPAQLQALQIKNLNQPLPHLITSGQPTEVQFEQLAGLGVKRMIQLRAANEPGTGWEEQKAQALGVHFVRLPITGADGITVANAQRLASELAAGGDDTTLVYCASSNRVGGLLAMKAFHVDGKTAEEALALGKAAGMVALEPAVKQKLVK